MTSTVDGEATIAPALAANEHHFRIASHHPQLRLFFRYLAPSDSTSRQEDVV